MGRSLAAPARVLHRPLRRAASRLRAQCREACLLPADSRLRRRVPPPSGGSLGCALTRCSSRSARPVLALCAELDASGSGDIRDPKPGTRGFQARTRKLLATGPQHVAVEHALGHVDDPPAGRPRVVAQALEGLALVDAVAAERHLDRRLHVLGVVRRDVGRDSGQVEVALAPCPGIRMRAIIG